MTQHLTQEQLNASTVIRGLVDIQTINIDERFGYGQETLKLLSNHIKQWDYRTRKELIEKLETISKILKNSQVIDRELKNNDPTNSL